MTFCWLLYFYF